MSIVTFTEIGYALNPTSAASKFQTSGISSTIQAQVLAAVDAQIKAYTPPTYLPFFTRFAGLVITREAVQGAYSYVLPAAAAKASTTECVFWRNFTGRWRDRRVSDAVSATVTQGATTATVTLDTALDEGDTLIGDVVHDGTILPGILKRWAVDLGVSELVYLMPTLQLDSELRAIDDRRNDQTLMELRDFRGGKIRLAEWDGLDFIDENETVWPRGTGLIDPTAGW